MQLWQMDVMGGLLLDDGTELKVVTGIDDHSRFRVAASLVRRAISKAVCEVLAASLARWGSPMRSSPTFKGKVFTGRFGPQPVEVMFDRICRENGISHRHTGVRSPTTTGKSERFHQSLRKEFLAVVDGRLGRLDGPHRSVRGSTFAARPDDEHQGIRPHPTLGDYRTCEFSNRPCAPLLNRGGCLQDESNRG